MVSALLKTVAIAATLATTAQATLSGLKLCKLPNYNLQTAEQNYPELSAAIKTVLAQGVATWYTDRTTEAERQDFLNAVKTNCSADETELIAVYGLPQKDCADGYSSSGGNRNNDDYKQWITDLYNAVGTRKVLYVYEPDALALTIDGKCGNQYDYLPNIRTGLSILSQNPNAKVYLDVGYWTLQWPALITQIITNFKKVEDAGRITGITIGTSNYRPIQEMVGLCGNFSREYGSTKYNCVLDTSRDYLDTVPGTDWCNQMWAGVGHPSTGDTGYSNIDAFLWVKPVGESDGTCNGGPTAGQFWYEGFVKWWNQGWFVQKGLMPQLTQTSPGPTQAPATTTPKPVPTTTTPSPNPATTTPSPVPGTTTPAPAKTTPAPATTTPVPATTTPVPATTTPAPASGGSPMWGQCGGINWSGATTCAQGSCKELNPYYFQCV